MKNGKSDALGVEFMIGARYDPNAVIRFHEMLRRDRPLHAVFLAAHPSGDERIQNVKRIIEANESKR